MQFTWDKAWYVKLRTAIASADLLVDTGAGISCLGVRDLAKLFGKTDSEIESYFAKCTPATKYTIDGAPIQLYPFEIPKVMLGDRLLPRFYCLVSMNPNFQSVVGLDLLSCGITHLQFKDKGNCAPFDFGNYKEFHSKRPFNRLAFLNYD